MFRNSICGNGRTNIARATPHLFDRVTDTSYKAYVRNVACQNAFNRINLEGEDPNALEKAYGEFDTQVAESVATGSTRHARFKTKTTGPTEVA
jgi:hypothetical protein